MMLQNPASISPGADTGGLEHGSVQWYGEDIRVGSTVLCCSYDAWQLCSLQSACGHLGGGVLFRGLIAMVSY